MSLFSEIGLDVEEILSDPEMATADVKIKRITGSDPGAHDYDDPIETYQLIKLSAVVFPPMTGRMKDQFSGESLVDERFDEITASPWATVIEEDGVAVNRRIRIEVLSTDIFFVDGDERRVQRIFRVPAAGPDVSVWQIRVVD